jgi:hypothetical protein
MALQLATAVTEAKEEFINCIDKFTRENCIDGLISGKCLRCSQTPEEWLMADYEVTTLKNNI